MLAFGTSAFIVTSVGEVYRPDLGKLVCQIFRDGEATDRTAAAGC
jgi:hypothetical protein